MHRLKQRVVVVKVFVAVLVCISRVDVNGSKRTIGLALDLDLELPKLRKLEEVSLI